MFCYRCLWPLGVAPQHTHILQTSPETGSLLFHLIFFPWDSALDYITVWERGTFPLPKPGMLVVRAEPDAKSSLNL